ncbi:CD226 protein, partial [Smithornis capensis]|nr:CD226 protein [Smithornis capensis]
KVKLQCIYPKIAVIIQIPWMKLHVTHKENTAVLFPIYGIHRKDKYNGRIYFKKSRADKSLSFMKSTLENYYLYICFIVTSPDRILWFSTDAFKVSEKQNIPLFTKAGGNVAFTHPYKIGNSVQPELCERIKADWVDIVAFCNSSGKQSFGSDFKGHVLIRDCSDQSDSGFVFQNITTSSFATYCCVASGRNKTYVMISTM